MKPTHVPMAAFGLLALSLAACTPATPPAPAADTAPAQRAPAAAADAAAATTGNVTAEVDNAAAPALSAADGSALDTKAFAGRFGDKDSVLALDANGGYRQELKAGGASLATQGTWTPDGPGQVLLDPEDKAAQDVRLQIVSLDELRSQDGTLVFKRLK